MSSQLDSLKNTFLCWKYLGLWKGNRQEKKSYKYYSIAYIILTLLVSNIAITVNLFYTPRNVELLIQEVTFFFNAVTIMTKVTMILYLKKDVIIILELLDCTEFQPKDNETQQILAEDLAIYHIYWKFIVGLGNFAYIFKTVIPIFAKFLFTSYEIKLPSSNYYFLNDHFKENYFVFIFIYQSISLYGLMMFDVTIDTFTKGLLSFAITQFKILNNKLMNFKTEKNLKLSEKAREEIQIAKLNECLRHYDVILKFCSDIQRIINIILFVQYGLASIIICVLLCGVLLPITTEAITFMVAFLLGMLLQIFIPGWLGSRITHESQELVFAAYNSDWIPRSEPFKKSIKLFMERANTPVVMVGLKIFPLSLETFTSILKTAYSFVTLVRNFQE